MAPHRLWLEDGDRADVAVGAILEIAGQEARHALRVKRLGQGDELELLNGRGLRAVGVIVSVGKVSRQGAAEWSMRVEVRSAAAEPQVSPVLHVLASAPKGPRLEEMIDQLSQVGAASWSPLITARTVVSPRMGKMLKAERVARESAKQCGRAWSMSIGEPAPLADVLSCGHHGADAGTRLIVADASGGPYEPDGATDITLLVGPEGGFASSELEGARSAGARVYRFGVHAMRVETAAVVASGIVLGGAHLGFGSDRGGA